MKTIKPLIWYVITLFLSFCTTLELNYFQQSKIGILALISFIIMILEATKISNNQK